ncbi:MAG: DUF819 family protein [Spirosomataceae bacterium]
MNSLYILVVLCTNVVLAEWLATYRFFKSLGAALIVIITTAITANTGLIPSSSIQVPVYDGIFTYLAPLSIFFLMLKANLRSLRKAGGAMVTLFLTGSLGTILGVVLSMKLFDAEHAIGSLYYAIAGMFTGTYIGGSVNYNAVALHYGVSKEGTLFAAATAADNIITTLWMIATLLVPQLLNRYYPRQKQQATASDRELNEHLNDNESVNPMNVALLLGLGLFSIYLSQLTASIFKGIPAVLVQTTFALALAQLPVINRLPGSRMLGLLCVYLFLAVIGAYCDIPALIHDGQLAFTLLGMIALLVLIHATVLFGIGTLLKQDWDMLGIASQANIGGASSALALSKSLNRTDLQLPAVLVGVLGNAIGTYLGIWVAEWMR